MARRSAVGRHAVGDGLRMPNGAGAGDPTSWPGKAWALLAWDVPTPAHAISDAGELVATR